MPPLYVHEKLFHPPSADPAQYVHPAKSVAYIGSVGDDDLKNTLQKANEAEGVVSAYQIQPAPAKTGACAVILSGHNRSLCTTLRAAEQFAPSHLAQPEIAALIDGAKYFYIEGYFLTHGIESALEVAKNASSKGKVVALNLSAPFIPQFFKVQLEELLPHVDILIGNESEAAAYATATGMAVCLFPPRPFKFWFRLTTDIGRPLDRRRHRPRLAPQIQHLPTPSHRHHPRRRLHPRRLFLPLHFPRQRQNL